VVVGVTDVSKYVGNYYGLGSEKGIIMAKRIHCTVACTGTATHAYDYNVPSQPILRTS
jgi:hypothetical protein